MRLTVCLEGNEEGRVLASVDMEDIVKMTRSDAKHIPEEVENTTSSENRILWLPGRGSCPAMLSGKIEMAEFLNLILQKAVPPWQPPLCPERQHWYYKNIRECPMKNFSVG